MPNAIASFNSSQIVSSIEIEIADNERDKSNELLPEQVALIDRSVLKAFVMCSIPFRVIENPYYVNMLKNLQPNYNPNS